jgi:hypothetical protein
MIFFFTVLGLLSLDHRKLAYFFPGRSSRLTDGGGDHNLATGLTAG